MKKLSISFTLGKASILHQANVAHSNREFIAPNVDRRRTHLNVTYVRQDVRAAYTQLFGQAVKEYNDNQKQKCRRIADYYQHIADGKREEAFYEVIVQFGDSKSAPCGSENGKIAEKMLEEYILSFQNRNPNLHVFNAVLHLDEASPHLHINFIPFYTKARANGLSCGVSMKAALDEMGFDAKNFKSNRLVAWEERERGHMETILQAHGFEREDKNAKHPHLSVEDYKRVQDEKKVIAGIRAVRHISSADLSQSHVQALYEKLSAVQQENTQLTQQIRSPFRPFYYAAPDMQSFVQTQLTAAGIPFRETENGFEVQACYVDRIREIEKRYKAPRRAYREILRDDIDRLLMQSVSMDELLTKLQSAGYTIKYGKYLAVRPKYADNFIRLKSLGEHYSEYALRNRLQAKARFERSIEQKIHAETRRDSPKAYLLRTVRVYTVAFKKNALPMRRRNQKLPYAWTNDAELDKLLLLNTKINSGATLESLREEFSAQEKNVSELDAAVQKAQSDLKSYYELKEKIGIVFEGKHSAAFTLEQAQLALQSYPNITQDNYRNIDDLIAAETESLRKSEQELTNETDKLRVSSELVSVMEKIMSGTYVQSLADEERLRRESEIIPNGFRLV